MPAINVRDPIHGFISLNDLEGELIQLAPFQRLRFIHQLGTSNWVYPGGVHTRFEHSLGVFYLASRVVEKINVTRISGEDKEIFKVACLLHDIGHAPFSHVGENADLFASGFKHETMGIKVIKESKIGEVIKKRLGEENLERISFIITGIGRPTSQLDVAFSAILTGQAGVDRMDYLLRDSHFLGVAYGRYDLARILETLRYNEERDLFWEEGGIHALEQFILARYFMFKDVYFHKTRRILDYHLGMMMKDFLRDVKGKEFLPTNIAEYIALNDNEMISYMLSNDKYSRIFIARQFYRLISRESSDHPDDEEVLMWENIEKKVASEFQRGDYYFDKADDAPYRFEEANEIKVEYNQQVQPLTVASSLVKTLRRIRKRRIYVAPGKRTQATRFVDSLLVAKRG